MDAINKIRAYFGMIPPSEESSQDGKIPGEKSGIHLSAMHGLRKGLSSDTFANVEGSNNEPANMVNGALALDYASKNTLDSVNKENEIISVKPTSYAEARIIGEKFRSGYPVIIDLVSLEHEEAKRLVDFSAGLAFALHGSFDKVATRIFLLSPMGVSVSPSKQREFLTGN